MATYTDNYNLIKPTYAETADIVPLNNNFEKIDEVMHASQTSLAPAYDQAASYQPGDVVMYELNMYKCTGATSGVWDPSKWTRTTASETGGGGGADLDIYGEASGTAEASFSDGAEASLVACEIGIEPQQDLHGYSKPWAGGAGKNKLSDTWADYNTYGSYRYFKIPNFSGGDYVMSFTDNDTSVDLTGIYIGFMYNYPDQNTQYRWCLSNGVIQSNTTNTSAIDNTTKCDTIIILPNTEATFNKLFQRYHIQVESGTTATTYEPYSNICPISGHTDVTVTVASTSGGSGEDTTVSLGRTVYGGTLDVTTGVLTVDKAIVDLGTLSWTNNSGRFSTGDLVNNISPIDSLSAIPDFICTAFKAESFYDAGAERDGIAEHTNKAVVIYCDIYKTKTGTEFANLMNGINLVYPLATPQTYNLTPTQVKTLLGQNYVSHDGGGTISLVYVKRDAPIKPNPADAEIPLTGLEIDGEKFKIESGGYHKALIWDSGSPTVGASYATDYALLDNLSNYDQIILMVSNNIDRTDANHQYTQQVWLDVEYILSSGAWHKANVIGFGTRYFDASFTDSSFKIIQGDGEDGHLPTIFQIYGVRY